MLQWAHSYYLTHIWTHKNNINWNVSVHHLFTSPVASQHLPLSCVYSDFFYTHKHTIMLKCLQMTCKIFLLLQTNLLEICYMWKNHDSFFSSISHTHTHTYTWKETHRISIFSLFGDPLLSQIRQAASLSIQPPAKPGLLINTSQCKQDEPAAIPVAHLSESPAETNAESRRMHVNPRMLMLEVNPNWQEDKFACSVTGWNLLTQLWFTLKESVWK